MNLDTVPEWSGMFLENNEVGYLEISDADDRLHRPPPGWTLVTIDECPEHSSQIFRYIRTEPARVALAPQVVGLLVAICATGASVLGLPIIHSMLVHTGLA